MWLEALSHHSHTNSDISKLGNLPTLHPGAKDTDGTPEEEFRSSTQSSERHQQHYHDRQQHFNYHGQHDHNHAPHWKVGMAIAVGFVVMFIVEKMSGGFGHEHAHNHERSSNNGSGRSASSSAQKSHLHLNSRSDGNHSNLVGESSTEKRQENAVVSISASELASDSEKSTISKYEWHAQTHIISLSSSSFKKV